MKKALMTAMMAALAAAAVFAHGHGRHERHGGHYWSGEWTIPQAAEDFIGKHFPDASVRFAGGGGRVCKVALSDGTEIAFAPDGSWHDIRCYAGVPLDVLPQAAADSARELYPDVPVMRAEKSWRGYELRLANRMSMFFDADGRLLGQKFDD